MIKKSQIKEVLLKYIVPLQKQYPDFYLGGSLALILQKHIPARDIKDLDIISPVSFGDLHETKFPYRGMVTSKKTYHIREIKTCLDFFHNPKAKFVTVKFQGHTIKLSPIDEIVHAKENKIWSSVYKNKQENLKQVIKEIFNEIKVQPVNKLIKPTKKETIIDKPYIDIDTSFIEDYILEYGDYYGDEYFEDGDSFDDVHTLITDDGYIDFVLDGNYNYYFNNNKKEIDYILTLDDPLSIKDYARDKAETLADNPEDIDFFTEEIMLAIEALQDYIPKYNAAKNILKDNFTLISNNEFSAILTTLNAQEKLGYTMIDKKEGYFNKNGEIVTYTT